MSNATLDAIALAATALGAAVLFVYFFGFWK
jgi:hypothetical protein